MKKSMVILCGVLLVFGVVGMSDATAFELREYFETLSIPYPEQSTNNLWTFHNKDHNEPFLPPGGPDGIYYYDYDVTGSIIGNLIPSGDPAWGGYGGELSYPTFDGVSVHSGIIDPTVAVFHAPQSMSISQIKLRCEMVGYGVPANGFDVIVNSVISGGKA